MKRYLQAALTFMGACFLLLFGLAILPLMVALVGTVAGVAVAFAPLTIAIVIVIVLANTIYKDK